MFGKPEWFREKSLGWGLTPTTWQGWWYTAAWTAVLIGPLLLLLAVGKYWEAAVWILVAIAGLTWDVRDILRQMKRKPQSPLEELLYIGEEGNDEAVTDQFHLKVKR